MSSFLLASAATPGGNTGLLQANEERVQQTNWRWNDDAQYGTDPWRDGFLWPMTRGLGQQLGMLSQDAGVQNRWGVEATPNGGGQEMLKFKGITRDATGNPLPNCVVDGFVTATNISVGTVQSDNGGYYELPTPFAATQHYLVAYKPGSPDVAGTTLNTLTPS